jgi:hypothetical protein
MNSLFRSSHSALSRRDFLKLSGSALLSMFTLTLQNKKKSNLVSGFEDLPTAGLGRVAAVNVILYDRPSFNGTMVGTLKRDMVLPITQTVIGDTEPVYNRIWYELDNRGYAHSGTIQPVENRLNTPQANLSQPLRLGEITVPYTGAAISPFMPNSISYRLYYGSTYWVHQVRQDYDGNLWYRVLDEEGYLFYIDGRHLHLYSMDEIAPISPDVPPETKRLEVHLDDQVVIAYEDNQPVFMTRAATGAQFFTGNYYTPAGQFITNRKRPSRHMMDPNGSSYDLPGVPWVTYLTANGISFHGTYWHNDFGSPRSHGCINLTIAASRWIYLWTHPQVPFQLDYLEDATGTTVDVI